ncbi:GntR family transcriptional regulator [Isoptericola sp. NPDC057191]|uniref:GntR family transcriptional regulator n=1 Tax=Isoptericola sp. NPDC057191 TaxID=3346041 RepID=UPI0036315D62
MPVPTTQRPALRRLLRDVVHDQLLAAIVAGDLAPGEVLHEQEIESWTGASRTPVREAIDRLAAHGFIEMIPQKETRVTDLDLGMFVDMLSTLGGLCTEVVRDAVPLLSESERAGIVALGHELLVPDPRNRTPIIGTDLFDLFIDAYANTVVMDIRDYLSPHVHRVINLRGMDAGYYMGEENLRALLAATEDGRADDAADLVGAYFDRLQAHVDLQRQLHGPDLAGVS